MVFVGTDSDQFGCFKTFCNIFDCDILFIKDIARDLWYLTIMEECRDIIMKIISDNKHTRVYSIGDSSGTIPLLNITKYLLQFMRGFIINGQPTLKHTVVKQYAHCTDCAIFNPSNITIPYTSYICPLEDMDEKMLSKYVFYSNNCASDAANYMYLKTIYPEYLHASNLIYEETNETHFSYIMRKFKDSAFLESIKKQIE